MFLGNCSKVTVLERTLSRKLNTWRNDQEENSGFTIFDKISLPDPSPHNQCWQMWSTRVAWQNLGWQQHWLGGGRGARVENDIEKALLNAAGKDFCQRLSEKLAVLEKTFSWVYLNNLGFMIVPYFKYTLVIQTTYSLVRPVPSSPKGWIFS